VRVTAIVAKHGYTIVERNQLRRRLKELARTRLIPRLHAMDVVLRAVPSAYEATFDELAQEVERITEQLSSGKTES